MKLSLSRSEADKPGWPDPRTADGLAAIAASMEPLRSRVDLILVDDRLIRSLNRDHRGKDRATDVLSFSYMEDPSATPEDDLAGEIYVSYETLERDAAVLGIDVEHLFLRIGVHGLLHIKGYRHDTDQDARDMEMEEKRLLGESLTAAEMEALF